MAASVSSIEDQKDILFDAASRGSLGEHKELLSSLGDVDIRNYQQETLLLAAVRSGVFDSVARLLGKGADPCSADSNGATVLDVARELESRYPGDSERKKITNLIKFVVDREKAKGSSHVGGEADELRPLAKEVVASLLAFKEEASTIGDSVKGIGDQTAKLSGDVSTLKSSLTRHHFFVKEALDGLRTESKGSVDSLHSSLSIRDDLLRKVEKKVDELSKQIQPLKKFVEDLRKSIESVNESNLRRAQEISLAHALGVSAEDEAGFRDYCIGAMMRRTEILKRTAEAEARTKLLYQMLYDNGSHTSALLRYAASNELIQVVIDYESYYIGEMKGSVTNLSGQQIRGGGLYTFADTRGNNVAYLGGRTSSSWPMERVAGQLAMSLAQLAICLAFDNGGRPYALGRDSLFEEYQSVVKETKLHWTVEDSEFDAQVKSWLESDHALMRESHVISAVPGMVASFGPKDGLLRARRKMRQLTIFYEASVMGLLLRKAASNLSN